MIIKHALTYVLLFFASLILAACGGSDIPGQSSIKENISGISSGNNSPSSQVSGTSDPALSESAQNFTALEILNTIWEKYEKPEQFPAAGGDPSEANSKMDGPGKFSLENPTLMDNILGFPLEASSSILDAASLTHLMNTNTFTAGAYHIKPNTSLEDFAKSMQSNIQSRQWICGFPEKLLILSTQDHLISAFGNAQLIETFKHKAQSAFDFRILVDEPIQ